jgi:hypothetical protein
MFTCCRLPKLWPLALPVRLPVAEAPVVVSTPVVVVPPEVGADDVPDVVPVADVPVPVVEVPLPLVAVPLPDIPPPVALPLRFAPPSTRPTISTRCPTYCSRSFSRSPVSAYATPPLVIDMPECSVWLGVPGVVVLAVPDAVPEVPVPVVVPVPVALPVPVVVPEVEAVPLAVVPDVPAVAEPLIVPAGWPVEPLAVCDPLAADALISTNSLPAPMPVPIVPPRPPWFA